MNNFEKFDTLEDFKEKFKPGDIVKFYYLDTEGYKKYVYGILNKYLNPGEKGYPSGGVDFCYHKEDDYEKYNRNGDISFTSIVGIRHEDPGCMLLVEF